MKVTKPKENQILIEDDLFKRFSLKVKSKSILDIKSFNLVLYISK